MKEFLKRIPVVGSILIGLNRIINPTRYSEKKPTQKAVFTSSGVYWENRYQQGGNSGAGSYDHFAEFKAEILNEFISEHNVNSVIELGCGDGNQLNLLNIDNYIGFDVSEKALDLCKNIFINDDTKEFRNMESFDNDKAELSLSLDVIYHLVEDNTFENYMKTLFKASDKFVIIYSSNTDRNEHDDPHVRHRKFTNWVSEHIVDFELIKQIPNRYPYDGDHTKTSFADFYIYQRAN